MPVGLPSKQVGDDDEQTKVKRTRGTLMSRGLGKLQRFIKEQIYRAEREYDRERVALEGRRRVILQRLGRDHFNRGERDPFDDGVKRWVVYWWDVRRWVDQNPAFNPDPEQYRLSEALECSAKRALHGLVQRGEIVQDREGKYATYYTIEMQKRLEDIGKGFAEDFKRAAAKLGAVQPQGEENPSDVGGRLAEK